MRQFPFVGKRITISRKTARTDFRHDDIVQGHLALALESDTLEGRSTRSHSEPLACENAVDIQLPFPVLVIETNRRPNPRVENNLHAPVGRDALGAENHHLAVRIERIAPRPLCQPTIRQS